MEKLYKDGLRQLGSRVLSYQTSDLETFMNERDYVQHGKNGILVFVNNNFALTHNVTKPVIYSQQMTDKGIETVQLMPSALLRQLDSDKSYLMMVEPELFTSGKIPLNLKGEKLFNNIALTYQKRDANQEDSTTLMKINNATKGDYKKERRTIDRLILELPERLGYRI